MSVVRASEKNIKGRRQCKNGLFVATENIEVISSSQSGLICQKNGKEKSYTPT